MHEMQTTATDDRGVCQSVCHAAQLGFTVQKRLNGSTFDWVLISHGEG